MLRQKSIFLTEIVQNQHVFQALCKTIQVSVHLYHVPGAAAFTCDPWINCHNKQQTIANNYIQRNEMKWTYPSKLAFQFKNRPGSWFAEPPTIRSLFVLFKWNPSWTATPGPAGKIPWALVNPASTAPRSNWRLAVPETSSLQAWNPDVSRDDPNPVNLHDCCTPLKRKYIFQPLISGGCVGLA